MSNNYGIKKVHWHLVAVEMHHVVKHEDKPVARIQRMNVIAQSPKRQITNSVLEDIKLATLDRALRDYNVKPEDVASYVILSITSLGYMTEREFLKKEHESPV